MRVGVIQCGFSDNSQKNCEQIIKYLKEAHEKNMQIVVAPELFLGHYFCKNQQNIYFERALSVENNSYLEQIQYVCKKLELVFPFSFFEKSGPNYFNSVAMIDADGELLGVYRKSHIPDGPGYQEKYYFRPGNTGFQVFNSRYGKIGCGICWDQWFPECARILTLKGADIIIYPTAIGSEPEDPKLQTCKPWRRAMIGHAVCNMIPIVAANRIGEESGQNFYGSSFVANHMGELILDMGCESGLAGVDINIARATQDRASFGFFRDRRCELYRELCK